MAARHRSPFPTVIANAMAGTVAPPWHRVSNGSTRVVRIVTFEEALSQLRLGHEVFDLRVSKPHLGRCTGNRVTKETVSAKNVARTINGSPDIMVGTQIHPPAPRHCFSAHQKSVPSSIGFQYVGARSPAVAQVTLLSLWLSFPKWNPNPIPSRWCGDVGRTIEPRQRG